jgi:hypothetical protein
MDHPRWHAVGIGFLVLALAAGVVLAGYLVRSPGIHAVAGPSTVGGTGANGSAPGLIINKAVYGDLPDGAAVDVTAKVAARVAIKVLTVAATNDNFGDPAFGIGKKLRVDYTIDGKAKSKTVAEGETLTITGD